MKKLVLLLGMFFLAGCETVPITGRQQVSLMSDSEIATSAARQFRTLVREADVVTDTHDARLVQTVGKRIKGAVESYFQSKGQSSELRDYRWEFVLIDSDEVNAFCLPGGKVAVYTGILPIAKTEEGLAVVMGHEVAHAIAKHGNERLSQTMLAETATAILAALVTDEDDDPLVGEAFQMAFGFGAELGVLLPFSRLHESEADHLGLIFMAMAGYDPREAPAFWRRMAAASGGDDSDMEFLSTHPSDKARVKELEAAMEEAQTYYRKRR